MNELRANPAATQKRPANRSWLILLAAAVACGVLAVVVSRMPVKEKLPTGVDASAPVSLAEGRQEAAAEFLELVDALGTTLASDDLDRFNLLVPRVAPVLTNLDNAFSATHPWHAAVKAVKESGQFATALNLEFARREFGPLSAAAVDFAKLARRQEAFKPTKIFQCPMATPPGLWLQTTGTIHNPYFGHEMPRCGREVTE